MAFPAGWKYRAKLTIDKTKVASDQTDFPVLLAVGNIPTDALDSNGGKPAIDGGGDLRFSSDALGATQLSCDVQQFEIQDDPATAKAEVWVKIPSVSSSVNTDFYMWWGKSAETQPARNASFGMESVWDSNFKGVWHMTSGWNTGANAIVDATASAKHGTASITAGAPTFTSPVGKWGGGKSIRCIDAASHSKDYKIAINGGSPLDFNIRGSTISAWLKSYDTQQGWWIGKGDDSTRNWSMRGIGLNTADHKVWWNRSGGDSSIKSSGTLSNDTWAHVSIVVAADGSGTFYINGSASGTFAAGTMTSENGTLELRLGAGGGGDVDARQESWRGNMDEIRISNTARTANNISTNYNSMNAPSTFLSYGTTTLMTKKKGFAVFFENL